MSRPALRGIGDAIKANTTEKSIEDLRAEGKKRVRVVSGERVMAIIQAIVDDAINSEVGEITKRDRDRLVTDTQARFSRVLSMQQDLEQQVDDLRGSLRSAELERDRLRADKALLEAQVETARRTETDSDAVARLGRDLARVREALERSSREPAFDEAALTRVAEKIASRESQTLRRLGAEFDDLRARLDAVTKDAAAARDASAEKALVRAKEQQSAAESQLAARLDRDFRAVADQLAKIREDAARAPAANDAVARLRGDLDAMQNRIQGVERSSSDLADRVAKSVMERIEQRDAVETERRGVGEALDAHQVTEALRRVHHASEESCRALLAELGSLRESIDEARTAALSVQAEQLRDLGQRVADGASEETAVVVRAIERMAERAAALDGSIESLRRDLVAAVERSVDAGAQTPPAVAEALREMRVEATQAATCAADAAGAAARTAETQAALASRLDGSLVELRGEFMALAARSIESAERQHDAVRGLREQIALSASAQSDAMQSGFHDALEHALDQITKTMERATARPIDTSVEATEALLAKIFDAPDVEMTTNLDQLDVEQRRPQGGIAKSVGRLKELAAPRKAEAAPSV